MISGQVMSDWSPKVTRIYILLFFIYVYLFLFIFTAHWVCKIRKNTTQLPQVILFNVSANKSNFHSLRFLCAMQNRYSYVTTRQAELKHAHTYTHTQINHSQTTMGTTLLPLHLRISGQRTDVPVINFQMRCVSWLGQWQQCCAVWDTLEELLESVCGVLWEVGRQ